MPLQATSGAASYDAFGGGAAAKVNYIEDFFQSYLRTGTGASATVTTGLDGSTKETLVWTKSRSAAINHKLTDNVRGATKALSSNTSDAEATDSQGLTAFSATGYTLGTNTDYNNSGETYVDWQWVSQPKFFDIVTYTGTGNFDEPVSHNLGAVPAVIMIKCTTAASDWAVRTTTIDGSNDVLILNKTDAKFDSSVSNSTSTTFRTGGALLDGDSGKTYVAYLFASNAGGFGLTGTDNVISCGSYTGNGLADGPTVSLGYEPQWLLIKNASAAESGGFTCNWRMYDNMRGWATGGDEARLFPNLTNAENFANDVDLTSTGFKVTTSNGNVNGNGEKIIYIAIRRPMKVPTSGTSVFAPIIWTGSGTNSRVITGAGFTPDMFFLNTRNNTNNYWNNYDRLRGVGQALRSYSTSAETSGINYGMSSFGMDGHTLGDSDGGSGGYNQSSILAFATYFKRAPSFFDVVCYTGTGSGRTVAHNLGVAPEFMIIKSRNTTQPWITYSLPTGNENYGILNTTVAWVSGGSFTWNNTFPTSTVFSLGASGALNGSGDTYVAYLFATCAGVSKVGSYTGTGTTKQIDCGFTGGARFVLIKRTDSTGDWYVWDTARGIVSGNDPYLLLNTTDAEVTNTDYIDTYSAGFEISSTAPAAINASGGSFVFLAIA